MFKEVLNNLPAQFRNSVGEMYIDGGFKGPCRGLAAAIWHNESMTGILNKLAGCSQVNSLYTKNEFTPMTLAAIQGNLPAMEALKEKNADLDVQDILGYTALHHMAMLGNEVGVSKLLDWNASPHLRTSYGATYMDLLRFTAPFRNGAISHDPKLFSAHTNDHTEFDQTCISTEVKTVDEVVSTPSMLMGLYAREAYLAGEAEEEIHPYLKKEREAILPLYEAFKRNPPQIAVKPAGSFCGLFAEEPIRKGTFIAEYVGELTTEGQYQDNEYVWSDYPAVDARPYRSGAAMANEGFPNAGAVNIEKIDGLPSRKLLFALENIKPGEEIRINYGAKYPLKWDPKYQERGFDSLKKYLQSHSWDAISESVHSLAYLRLAPGISQQVDERNHKEKSFYILETPAVFYRLAKEGLIARKDLGKIRQLIALFDQLNPDGKEHRKKVLQVGVNALKTREKTEL